jgi:hypothetical protein
MDIPGQSASNILKTNEWEASASIGFNAVSSLNWKEGSAFGVSLLVKTSVLGPVVSCCVSIVASQ